MTAEREDKGQKEGREREKNRKRREMWREEKREGGGRREEGIAKCTRALHHMIMCLWSRLTCDGSHGEQVT